MSDVAYFLTTYWIYIVIALLVGLLTGWFSYAVSEDTEGEGDR